MIFFAIALYAVAMLTANLLVAQFGPGISPVLAFCFIGLDLTLRDRLQGAISANNMLLVILGTGAVSYALNPAAGMIAVGSTVAFLVASGLDWAAFTLLRGSWMTRSLGSNAVSALVDSIIFPVLAFGGFPLSIILLQYIAKMAGGAVWAFLLRPRNAIADL